jgi:hypothetical protein
MLGRVMSAMTLQRGLLPCCQSLWFPHYDLRDLAPAHFQRARDSRNGLFGFFADFGFFFICPALLAQ